MKKKPLISIVIPIYNSEKYIQECIDSILVQTFQDFEIIIVDDGSFDKSIERISSYNDDRIILIKNTHNYIQSLNIGMNRAQAKYIARMDSDDIMLPNRLELQYNFMETHLDVDVCGGGAHYFGNSNMDLKPISSHNDIILNLILSNSLIHPTVIMKRKIISLFPHIDGIYECYNPLYIYAEDYKLWTDLSIKGCRFFNIPEIILQYRVGPQQVTNRNYKEMLDVAKKISFEYCEQLINDLIEKDESFEKFIDETINLYNSNKISHNTLLNIFHNMYKDSLFYNMNNG